MKLPEGGLAAALDQAPYEGVVNMLCSCVSAEPEEKLALLALDSIIERGRRAQEIARRRRPRPALPAPPPPPPDQSGERN